MLRQVFWRPDVVVVVAPALASAPAGLAVARLTGALAWLHVQDMEVDAAFALGLLRGGWVRQGVLAVERGLLHRFDKVSTISSAMLKSLAAKGVPTQRLSVLPNGVDLQQIKPLSRSTNGSRSTPLRQALGITRHQVVCLFAGTLNRKHGLAILPAVAKLLKQQPHIVLVVCGDGEQRATLELAAAGCNNLKFIGLQPAAHLNTVLNMADIHLLPQMSGTADFAMPSKVAGMLASGRPVVAAATAGSELAVLLGCCGLVVEPESAVALAQAIASLANNDVLRARLGKAARAQAEAVFCSRSGLDRLSAQMLEALRQRQGPRPQSNCQTSVAEASLSSHMGPGDSPEAVSLLPPTLPAVLERSRGTHARAARGFTLLELLVVMVIIGLLAAYVGPKYFSQVGKSEIKSARAQIVGLEKALEQYRIDVGRYPSTEQGLVALITRPADTPRWSGPYLSKALPADPWGQPYQYKTPGEHGEVDVASLGRDGRPGGEGADADIGNW